MRQKLPQAFAGRIKRKDSPDSAAVYFRGVVRRKGPFRRMADSIGDPHLPRHWNNRIGAGVVAIEAK